jgi:glutamate dehydrogenase
MSYVMKEFLIQTRSSYSEHPHFLSFLDYYAQDLDSEVLESYSSENIAQTLKQHFDWAYTRTSSDQYFQFFVSPYSSGEVTTLYMINNDVPFLVDSIHMLLKKLGLHQRWMSHPVIPVIRNNSGVIEKIGALSHNPSESWMVIQIDAIQDINTYEQLSKKLEELLKSIHEVHQDRTRMQEAVQESKSSLPDEEQAYIDWLLDRHFVFLGCCDYELVEDVNTLRLKVITGSGMGIMRHRSQQAPFSESFDHLPPALKQLSQNASEPIILNKAEQRSLIHRDTYFDFIGIKRYNKDGKVIGERRVLGLYTQKAWSQDVDLIPMIRKKCEEIRQSSHFSAGGHKSKILDYVLNSYPLDELFETDSHTLTPITYGMVQLHERPRTRLFIREDRYQRYLSAFIFIPRDVFNGHIRRQTEALLLAHTGGNNLDYNLKMDDNPLVLMHCVIHGIHQDKNHTSDTKLLEQQIIDITQDWGSHLSMALKRKFGSDDGAFLIEHYKQSFPGSYRASFSYEDAAEDIYLFEMLSDDNPIKLRFDQKHPHQLHLKVASLKQPVPLFVSLPILENLGLKVISENNFHISDQAQQDLWISDLALNISSEIFEPDAQQRTLQVLENVLNQRSENDGLNRLVSLIPIHPRDLILLRAWCKYLRQGGIALSILYMEQCLIQHAGFAHQLIQLFHALLDPENHHDATAQTLQESLKKGLERLDHADEDKILTALFETVCAIQRTNYWQNKDYVSFKLHSNSISFLPQPRPLYEIWVYSPKVEGIHLRGSKVARGGLRWSDRIEDFRTEVLGLVKAQMVKNAVIIPTGSKGGFVGKQLPPSSDREAWLAEGINCYKTFICALLDLTDNIVDGAIIPPSNVVRRDEDDPYLVVAADKGTATFSDIANTLSKEYGFWLGDAFASGGSQGYDHKKMGITAKGAWESAKRHFRHLGMYIQKEDFTVIGIGDMAGDVFGNGMLLSPHIRLLAAFNHAHIFLDPNPNAQTSFEERQRIFALPRSSWADYKQDVISQGGGIFERQAKSIPLSKEVREWLECSQQEMSPNDLIHTILKAKANMLYNGGIGTYIKASQESHADAKDRANDAVRVDGKDLQIQVLVEGGNLGATQLGRIEFAQKGGYLYTDAIDNSAGVDCSDHEVNIKILLSQKASLKYEERNELLSSMTQEVADLVLRNNYLQTQILSMTRQHAPSMLRTHARMIQSLEERGLLNRTIEYLPSESNIQERIQKHMGLTTPEMAVLLAYSKMELDHAILSSNIPDDSFFESVLHHYFPSALHQNFKEEMQHHPLKREIIANQLANHIINRMGMTFVFRIQEEMSSSVESITRAWWVSMQLVNAERYFKEIESFDDEQQVNAELQVRMMSRVRILVERITRRILRNPQWYQNPQQYIKKYASSVDAVLSFFKDKRCSGDEGYAYLEQAINLMDILESSESLKQDPVTIAKCYETLQKYLHTAWLSKAITELPRDNRWQSLARVGLRDELCQQQRTWLEHALKHYTSIDSWAESHQEKLLEIETIMKNIECESNIDFSMLSAVLHELNHRMKAE